jgi:NAD-dependent deacetylase
MEDQIKEAIEIIRKSKYCIAFTGAGVSVESGIPPFRGENGIWDKYDPDILEISYFKDHPEESWKVIREIFYNFFGKCKPNAAHKVLAYMEKQGLLEAVITQNIDNLHQEAGSENVYEFHGNAKRLICLKCSYEQEMNNVDLTTLPVMCPKCGGLMKPDFIFFGEKITPQIYQDSFNAAENADVCIIVGSTGAVFPAAYVPIVSRKYGATIIEINPEKSEFTRTITNIWLKGKAGEVFEKIEKELKS